MVNSITSRNDETDSTTNADLNIFSDDNNNDTDDEASLIDEEPPDLSDDDTDDEASLFDDKEQHSPEHYLAESAALDVLRLQQRRYTSKTQTRLKWVKEY